MENDCWLKAGPMPHRMYLYTWWLEHHKNLFYLGKSYFGLVCHGDQASKEQNLALPSRSG